jgi:hypothetical protein
MIIFLGVISAYIVVLQRNTMVLKVLPKNCPLNFFLTALGIVNPHFLKQFLGRTLKSTCLGTALIMYPGKNKLKITPAN